MQDFWIQSELYGKPFTDYIPTERGDLKLYKELMSGIPTDLKTTSRLGCQPGEHQQQLLAETSHSDRKTLPALKW